MTTAEEIIKALKMKPLALEGGFYCETYRAKGIIPKDVLPKQYGSDRSFGTAILYLIDKNSFSSLHRIKSDEVFHFYMGDSVTMLQLLPDGSSKVSTLGRDITRGQKVQLVVPANVWQGCFVNDGGEFALMGTTVTPGFEFEDFEPADRDQLLEQYPDQRKLILRLTR